MNKKLINLVSIMISLAISATLMVHIQYTKKIYDTDKFTETLELGRRDNLETFYPMSGVDIISSIEKITEVSAKEVAKGNMSPWDMEYEYNGTIMSADALISKLTKGQIYQVRFDEYDNMVLFRVES